MQIDAAVYRTIFKLEVHGIGSPLSIEVVIARIGQRDGLATSVGCAGTVGVGGPLHERVTFEGGLCRGIPDGVGITGELVVGMEVSARTGTVGAFVVGILHHCTANLLPDGVNGERVACGIATGNSERARKCQIVDGSTRGAAVPRGTTLGDIPALELIRGDSRARSTRLALICGDDVQGGGLTVELHRLIGLVPNFRCCRMARNRLIGINPLLVPVDGISYLAPDCSERIGFVCDGRER